MTDASDSKLAALDQLRQWRVWFDRRDPLIYAAHLAGASLSEIRDASGVAVNTARSAIVAQEAAVQTATDPLAKYHHPHFLSLHRPDETRFEWAFKPFTGNEPKPELPSGPYRRVVGIREGSELVAGLSHDELIPLYQEYDAALKLWAAARFRRQVPPLMTKLVPLWAAYQQARAAMDEAFEALLRTEDPTWRAQILRLTGLQADARTAAAAWDKAELELLELYNEFRAEAEYRYDAWDAPELEDMISSFGADVKAWKLNQLDDHRPGGYDSYFLAPAAKETDAVIERQKNRIREVVDLTGEPSA